MTFHDVLIKLNAYYLKKVSGKAPLFTVFDLFVGFKTNENKA